MLLYIPSLDITGDSIENTRSTNCWERIQAWPEHFKDEEVPYYTWPSSHVCQANAREVWPLFNNPWHDTVSHGRRGCSTHL